MNIDLFIWLLISLLCVVALWIIAPMILLTLYILQYFFQSVAALENLPARERAVLFFLMEVKALDALQKKRQTPDSETTP